MSKRPILFVLLPLCIVIILFDAFVPTFFIRNHYSLHSQAKYFQVLIKDNGQQKEHTVSYTAQIIYYSKDSLWHSTTGDIILYKSKDDSSVSLHYGDVITCPNKLYPIKNFNSQGFDYKKYMAHKRIYDCLFIGKDDYKVIAHNKGNPIITAAQKVNSSLQKRILQSSLPKDEAGLACGMLLGNKVNIAQETKAEFYNLSLSHILCVSGLHIGIISMVLGFCLNIFCLWIHNFYIIKRLIMILLCFALSFIVGLTPSSLRVAVMMSIFFASQISKTGYDSLNALCVTAFIFLVFNPLLLFNLSFQFSFLAVAGICVFAKYKSQIALKLFKGNTIAKTVFAPAAMTFSAQIFVLPLSLFYFRRLPTYSLIANMIVVPFLSVILVSILLFLCFADCGFVGLFVQNILHYELFALKGIVHFLNTLPFNVITF